MERRYQSAILHDVVTHKTKSTSTAVKKAWNPIKQGYTLSSHHPLHLHYVTVTQQRGFVPFGRELNGIYKHIT